MRKTNKKFYNIIFLLFITFSLNAESKILSEGKSDAKITIKVFSSLTCPACANFHSKIYYKLKKDFIDKGLVKFEHHPFPLDLAALNAEIILRCHGDNSERFQLLSKIYEKKNRLMGVCIESIVNLTCRHTSYAPKPPQRARTAHTHTRARCSVH